MAINVVVFDALHLSRFALTTLLNQNDQVRVIGSVDTPLAVLEFAEVHEPDVVVFSFEGRDGHVLEIAEKVAGLPACRTLLLATTFTRSVVRRAFNHKIDGMVRRNEPPNRLLEAIRLVHQGQRVFDTELTVAALANQNCPLTLRQLAVLEFLSYGDTVIEIATRLCLSEGTVRNYISSIVAKLGARNRIDALRIARDLHWI